MEEKTTTLAKARRIGGSLVITIPAILVKAENINENDILELKVKKKRVNYFGALKGIGSYNRKEDRMEDRL